MENPQAPEQHSKVFCILPWIHLNVMPDSTVLPCCVSPYDDVFGDGRSQNLKDIWNSEKFKTLRKNMLTNLPSPGCARCYSLENSGFKSMRTEMNQFFQDYFPLAKETNSDGTVNKLQLKYIDIRFSNLCNFKCRGCSPALSSSWQKDHEALYGLKGGDSKVKSVAVNSPNLWKELFSLVPDADVIYFGGGEPLITKEHYDVLNLLNSLEKYDIELRYTTNLSQLHYGEYNLSDFWKNFKKVTLGISIDDIGPRAEYFRHGTKWNVIEKNLQILMEKHPQIIRNVNCTINLLNVYHFPDIYEYTVLSGLIEPREFNVNLLLDPEELRVDVLPADLKKKITVRLKKFKFKLQCMDRKYHYALKDIDSILTFMNNRDRSELLNLFKEKTLRLDQLRGEDFASTYPELSGIIS